MGQYHLGSLFNPRHIAVVGASEKNGTIGHALMKNLIDGGFAGMILPVNPKYKSIQDHDCVKSVCDLMPGVARIIGEPDGKTAEFSVLVGDTWQGKGIGSSLLEKCLAIAEKQGYKTIHGIVLGENRNMLALGKKLGFEIGRDPEFSDYNLVIHL